jgi:hypothetical protein
MFFKNDKFEIGETIGNWLTDIHDRTRADIFLVDADERNEDGSPRSDSKEQMKFVIYGDNATKENAKVRILIMIDQLVSLTLTFDSH